MARLSKILLALFFIGIIATGCQKNYYSGKAKSSDCGCPNKKGMSGY
jgi:hypothetical protein